MTSRASYRADIDGLRAIAIALVVAYHAFPHVVAGGFIGVDVFFVVSGFLISGNIYRELGDRSFSLLGFYARRCRRIVPALVVVLATTTALAWAVLPGGDFTRLGRHLVGGATFTSNLLLVHEVGYFNTASALKPFLHLWSLGIEEQFYLVWPIALVIWSRLRASPLALAVVLLAASFAIDLRWASSNPAWDFYLLPSRFWELAIGCALAGLVGRGAGNPTIKTVLGLALLAAGAICIDDASRFPGWWALLPTGAAALSIWAGPDAWWNRTVLASRPFVLVGKISYPLYLWHWPLLAILRATSDDEPSAASKLAVVAVAVVLALLTWRLLERRVQQHFTFRTAGFFKSPAFAVLASGAVLAVLAATGLAIYADAIASRDQWRHPAAYQLQRYASYDPSATRLGRCFVDTSAPFDGFDPACLQSNTVLLGDSLAAHLYPGLAEVLAERGVVLSQLDASSCPPVEGLDDHHAAACRAANAAIFRALAKQPPSLVIMEANWIAELGDVSGELRATIASLVKQGARVVVVGPMPAWEPTLPRVIERDFVDAGLAVPSRTKTGLDVRVFAVDAELRRLAGEAGASYISLVEPLCTADGCLVRVGPDLATDLLVYDSDHLTTPGSRFVARTIVAPQLPSR